VAAVAIEIIFINGKNENFIEKNSKMANTKRTNEALNTAMAMDLSKREGSSFVFPIYFV
jgi:hypothetical protein